MTTAQYDVVPQRSGWLVRLAADSVSEWFPDKNQAVRRAHELARRYDEWRVRVFSPAGTLEHETTSAPSAQDR